MSKSVVPRKGPGRIYLESQSRLDLVCQNFRDTSIKVCQYLHRELRLDTSLADQIVKGICERHADT